MGDALKVSVKAHIATMVSQMQAEGHPCQEVILSGHSLGGAMAALCAVDLAAEYPGIKISLWTYGKPRVFRGSTKTKDDKLSAFHANWLLSHEGNSNHRYMANGDPVPNVPLENMSFMHCGDGLELKKGGSPECKHCGMD